MRVFLDANVLFSAAFTDGAVRRLLRDLTAAGHVCVADGYVWDEARRNVVAAKPAASGEFRGLTAVIELHAEYSGAGVGPAQVDLVDKDRPVLASAIALRCGMLITGDRTHFGQLFGKTIDGVTIHTPRSAAEALL